MENENRERAIREFNGYGEFGVVRRVAMKIVVIQSKLLKVTSKKDKKNEATEGCL